MYLHGLASQHTIDLLLLSDAAPPAFPPNARRAEMTVDQLRELATAKLGTPVRLHRIRNICDLKPAYGMVFEDFIKGYEYWAWGDEDMPYGHVDRMLAPHLDGTVDLVAITRNPAKQSLGPLAVLRNDSRVNELAIRDPAYKDVLVSHEHWAYDETSWRYGGEISSFTKIATEAQARGELSIRRGIPMATHVPKRGRWYVYDGRTLHEDDGTEILYYHWGPMRPPQHPVAERRGGKERVRFLEVWFLRSRARTRSTSCATGRGPGARAGPRRETCAPQVACCRESQTVRDRISARARLRASAKTANRSADAAPIRAAGRAGPRRKAVV